MKITSYIDKMVPEGWKIISTNKKHTMLEARINKFYKLRIYFSKKEEFTSSWEPFTVYSVSSLSGFISSDNYYIGNFNVNFGKVSKKYPTLVISSDNYYFDWIDRLSGKELKEKEIDEILFKVRNAVKEKVSSLIKID